ncbi:outer membrane beta-barrel protein [uncultured Christiangramia sp.]|uniref:OmpP1/FadL family transporter n=1 Tax=Christiangramia sp. LLG6405-1 TaxID=3160832 RepID=UPI0025E1CBD6|nr:outer membrane beta-barrel protein [uncultured Christiangramia sp.]|tara:strand:- start:1290 stop:2534 length:1245 start_codon:yes stop_codon:yes gene_type:complete
MIKRFIVIVALFTGFIAEAQENVSSPYSYYGIGLTNFQGTVENRSMGGLSVFMDSIHVNLQNPASYGRLKLTDFTIGASHDRVKLETDGASDNSKISSLDYLALAFPISDKIGIGLGVMPYTSVGYRILDVEDDASSLLTGRGGMNRVFLSAGYAVNEHLSLGVDADYNFGNFQNTQSINTEGLQYGTSDVNRSDIKGFTFNFGANYQRPISEKLNLHVSTTYAPEMDLDSENFRTISTIDFASGTGRTIDQRELDLSETQFTFPSKYSLGAGIGQTNKWFVGAEYSNVGSSSYQDSFSFRNDGGEYEDASQFSLGGFYVPDYNSFTSYLERVVYRAGFRYDETGLIVNGESINEFGMSFGLGLPIGQLFSNANFGIELGQRGTRDAGLVQEKFLRLSVGLSLNDKWFTKRKFD